MEPQQDRRDDLDELDDGWGDLGELGAHDVAADSLVLQVGAARYGVGLHLVGEVGREPALTRVPGLPPWVAGVANWRGRVLAVVALAAVLGEDSRTARGRRRLVVLRTPAVTVGLVVDAVAGVRTLAGHEVALVAPTVPERTAAMLRGQVDTAEGPVWLLDVDALLGLRDSLPGARHAG